MKNKNLIDSFNNAINGIVHAVKSERNMRIHVAAALCVLFMSMFYELTKVEFLIVCITIAFVIVCELFNTAVEALVDIIVDVYHPKAKVIKDVAAGAVMVSALLSVLVGYFIFFNRLSIDIEAGIKHLEQSPVNITVLALVIIIIAVICLKLFFKTGTPLHGGMPSGHSALAFSLTTAVSLITDDARIVLLCFAVSLMVVQSRLEAKIHNILEVVAGGLIGFLVTLLLFQLFYI